MNHQSDVAVALPPWKILIVDDDQDVHSATRFALQRVRFRGRSLEIFSAYTGAESLALLRAHPDMAVALVDVIMETEDAGLMAIQDIRQQGFKLVRLIVRTGFPGQAPEREVIVNYDIHDYREKAKTSSDQLYSTLISALRSYADLVSLDSHRRGLLSVLDAVSWFDFIAVRRYVSGMLSAFTEIAGLGAGEIVMFSRPSASADEKPTIVAALDSTLTEADKPGEEAMSGQMWQVVLASFHERKGLAGAGGKTLFARDHGIDVVVFAAGVAALVNADEVLLEVFLAKVCQAISNHETFALIKRERNGVFRGLALRAEHWHDRGDTELDRLATLSATIARRLETTLLFPEQLSSQFIEDIGIASQLHDIGNAALPTSLLHSPSAFDQNEITMMRSHVSEGIAMFEEFAQQSSKTGIVPMARDVISCHHEHWDGSGYPNGLTGDAIPLSAQIVALADSYVAMTSARPYRPEMSAEAARRQIEQDAGKKFDERLVRALLEVLAGDNG